MPRARATWAVTALERMSGGAVQENWALDVEVDGRGAPLGAAYRCAGGRAGEPDPGAGVSRCSRVAHGADVLAPEPCFLCEDPPSRARPFFIMQRLPGVTAGHKVTRDAAARS